MSIRLRIILTHLLIVGIGFFYLVKKITDTREIKPRYMQSIEEPMVDMARIFAALLEHIDPAPFRSAVEGAKSRPFIAKIYNKEKTTVDLNVYVTDEKGIVIFDSDDGRRKARIIRVGTMSIWLCAENTARVRRVIIRMIRPRPCSTSPRR